MGQATDDFTILLNVLARTGLDGDVLSEFSKAKSMVHKYDSQKLMTEQKQAISAPINTQPIQNTPAQETMPPVNQNQAETIQEQGMGQGDLNLPPM